MELEELRKQIDGIDAALIELLQRRMDAAAGIAAYKRENGLPVLDAAREADKLSDIRSRCRPELGTYVARLYEAMFSIIRDYEQELLDRE